MKITKRQVNKRHGVHSAQARYSEAQKLEAVTLFLLYGNISMVSVETKVPRETIHAWKRQDWWKNYEQEIRNSGRIQTSNRLGKLVDKAMSALDDRIVNGDVVYDSKLGKVVRVPMRARDLNSAVNQSIDRQEMLEKILRAPEAQKQLETVDSRLDRLYDEFKKFAKGASKPTALPKEIIDVDYTEVKVEDLVDEPDSEVDEVVGLVDEAFDAKL